MKWVLIGEENDRVSRNKYSTTVQNDHVTRFKLPQCLFYNSLILHFESDEVEKLTMHGVWESIARIN